MLILGLFPELYRREGGIPRYHRLLTRALREYQRAHETDLRLLSLGDVGSATDPCVAPGAGHGIESFGGNRRAFCLRAWRLLLFERPAFTLVGHVNLATAISPLAPRAFYCVALHGIEVWARLRWTRRRALRRAQSWISISAYTARVAADVQRIRGKRYHLVPPALDLADWPRPPLVEDSWADSVRLLTVSRLDATETGKGIDHLIEAVAEVRRCAIRVTLEIVGTGPDAERLAEIAESLGVSDHVVFRGFLGDVELRRAYQECDVFVLPSSKEGFGIVFLEAMASGKPVIGADAGGIPEVVRHGTDGVLVPYGDVEALSEAIVTVGRDAALRRAMGSAGRQRVEESFTYEHLRRRLWMTIDCELAGSG